MWEKIKHSFGEHPYAWGIGIFLIGLILVYYLFGRSSAAPAVAPASGIDPAAAALAAAQMQQQGQIALAGIQAGVMNNQTGASLTLGSQSLTDTLAAIEAQGSNQLSLATIEAGTVQQGQSLQAQIAGKQIETGVSMAAIEASANDFAIAQNTFNQSTQAFLADRQLSDQLQESFMSHQENTQLAGIIGEQLAGAHG